MGYGETLSNSDSKELKEFGSDININDNNVNVFNFWSDGCNKENITQEMMGSMIETAQKTNLLPQKPKILSVMNIPKDTQWMDNMANNPEMKPYISKAVSTLFHGYEWSDLWKEQRYSTLKVAMSTKIEDENSKIRMKNQGEYDKVSGVCQAIYNEGIKDLLAWNSTGVKGKLRALNESFWIIKEKVTYHPSDKTESDILKKTGYTNDFSVYAVLPEKAVINTDKIVKDWENYPKYTNFNDIQISREGFGYNAKTQQLEMYDLDIPTQIKIEEKKLGALGEKLKDIVNNPSLNQKIDQNIASLSRRCCDPNNPNTKGDIDKAKSMFLRDLKPMIDNEEKKKQCRELWINIW